MYGDPYEEKHRCLYQCLVCTTTGMGLMKGPTSILVVSVVKQMLLLDADNTFCCHMFQGREDLRRDERLMQLVAAANDALQVDPSCARRSLHAHTFAVIPLGPRMGLIQWVPDARPISDIYRAAAKRVARRDRGLNSGEWFQTALLFFLGLGEGALGVLRSHERCVREENCSEP
jgi:hypothetical protein